MRPIDQVLTMLLEIESTLIAVAIYQLIFQRKSTN
ncbi:MAG: hypothetical protein JWQ70_1986 [Aeromicrobium sp.]|jgi:hypothetical protein|nr:hypothetical protein [Aeromicrobium sp.]